MTDRLTTLEQLARSATPAWDGVLEDMLWEGRGGGHVSRKDSAFINACDPGTVLALVRVALAARALREADKAVWSHRPQHGSAATLLSEARSDAQDELRAALVALEETQ